MEENMKKDSKCDVIIVGGGTSGVIAAIAAARNGCSPLLVERYGFLGGAATYGSCIHGFFSCDGKKVVNGIPDELIKNLETMGGSPGHLTGGDWGPLAPPGLFYSETPYDIEIYKYVAQKMIVEAGGEILFHTAFAGAIMENGIIKGVKLLTKGGMIELLADVVVDATGDGDVAAAAGCPFELGDKNGKMQNVTMLFSLGNVDFDRVFEYSKENKRIRTWGEWYTRAMTACRFDEKEKKCISFCGKVILDEDGENGKQFTCAFQGYRAGELRLNITRTIDIDGTDSFSLSKAEISEREQVFEVFRAFKKYIPGCENAYVLTTSVQVGIRESRRILGDYLITKEDVVEGHKFEDCIAKGGYTIDNHDFSGKNHDHAYHTFAKGGDSYDIPYRSLLPQKVEGLLVAARCISGSREAHASIRNMATVMAIGQAAGTAAALAVKNSMTPRKLDIQKLRACLSNDNAIV
jgi:hypothetical protein